MSHTNFTRRDVLATSTAGIAVLGFGLSAAQASDLSFSSTHACAERHANLGRDLYGLVSDRHVSEADKNLALKTSACPDCGIGIAPSGFALAEGAWA